MLVLNVEISADIHVDRELNPCPDVSKPLNKLLTVLSVDPYVCMTSVLIFRYVAESKLEIVKNTALELEYVFNTISPVPMKFTIDDVELAVRK